MLYGFCDGEQKYNGGIRVFGLWGALQRLRAIFCKHSGGVRFGLISLFRWVHLAKQPGSSKPTESRTFTVAIVDRYKAQHNRLAVEYV